MFIGEDIGQTNYQCMKVYMHIEEITEQNKSLSFINEERVEYNHDNWPIKADRY